MNFFLSVRFITKLQSKEDVAVSIFSYNFMLHYTYIHTHIHIYNLSHTSLDLFVNLCVNWPINSLFIGNLTYGLYDVDVL